MDDPLGYASVDLSPMENVKMHHHGADLSEQGTVFLRLFWQADGDAPPPASFKEVHTSSMPNPPPPVASPPTGYGREAHKPPPEFAPPPPPSGGGMGGYG